MKPIKVLIVDDSRTIRVIIRSILSKDPAIEVVGEAEDPYEARDLIKALSPDVLTLDVEMPRMNGIKFLENLMRLRPIPVIMVSTLTHKGATCAIEALSLGAFDCIGKPADGDAVAAFADLPEKVKAAAMTKPSPLGERVTQKAAPAGFMPNDKIVAIGSSTGGVDALLKVISGFPANCPPTVITQHMPEAFTKSFAARLDQNSAATVAEAVDGAPLKPGHVYLAPGGSRHLEVTGGVNPVCRLYEGETVSGHRPSVDVLFNSVARHFGRKAVGVILTGMGKDGAEGLLAIREAGGNTMGQDEGSCVIYGMPKAAFEIGAVERQVSISLICNGIIDLCNVKQAACA